MNYNCPNCGRKVGAHKLFFSDITACKECGQKVVLGDVLAFFVASMSMLVMAVSALYKLSHIFYNPIVAGGYAVAIGMVTGIVVLLVLGRAKAYKRIRRAPQAPPTEPAAKS
jgi:DNA-directed RNA polymerase subunit RPC12/RpoP